MLQGLKSKLPQARINYAKGCDVGCDRADGFEEAAKAARESDVVILAVGESAEMSGEAASRTSLDLPGRQLDLVKAVQATGKPTIVVLMNGRPLTINWIAENTPAILETWFSGTQAGNAIADVLFGDVNPGGKLPVTFPRAVGQVPLYYNHFNTGRPPDANNKDTSSILTFPVTPLFLRYGLLYAVQDHKPTTQCATPSSEWQADRQCGCGGTWPTRGDEVVQLYIRDVVASAARPVKELKGSSDVAALGRGEKKRNRVILGPESGWIPQSAAAFCCRASGV